MTPACFDSLVLAAPVGADVISQPEAMSESFREGGASCDEAALAAADADEPPEAKAMSQREAVAALVEPFMEEYCEDVGRELAAARLEASMEECCERIDAMTDSLKTVVDGDMCVKDVAANACAENVTAERASGDDGDMCVKDVAANACAENVTAERASGDDDALCYPAGFEF